MNKIPFFSIKFKFHFFYFYKISHNIYLYYVLPSSLHLLAPLTVVLQHLTNIY